MALSEENWVLCPAVDDVDAVEDVDDDDVDDADDVDVVDADADADADDDDDDDDVDEMREQNRHPIAQTNDTGNRDIGRL